MYNYSTIDKVQKYHLFIKSIMNKWYFCRYSKGLLDVFYIVQEKLVIAKSSLVFVLKIKYYNDIVVL